MVSPPTTRGKRLKTALLLVTVPLLTLILCHLVLGGLLGPALLTAQGKAGTAIALGLFFGIIFTGGFLAPILVALKLHAGKLRGRISKGKFVALLLVMTHIVTLAGAMVLNSNGVLRNLSVVPSMALGPKHWAVEMLEALEEAAVSPITSLVLKGEYADEPHRTLFWETDGAIEFIVEFPGELVRTPTAIRLQSLDGSYDKRQQQLAISVASTATIKTAEAAITFLRPEPEGWSTGRYRAEISLDGKPERTLELEIRKLDEGKVGVVSRTAGGRLIVDLAAGVEFEEAVGEFRREGELLGEAALEPRGWDAEISSQRDFQPKVGDRVTLKTYTLERGQ